MATAFDTIRSANSRDRAFFFAMSLAIAATIVLGFTAQFVMGRSSLGAPWWVHLHGLTFIGWLGIYVAQNALVYRGSIAQHRRLGMVAVGYLGWMVLVGLFVNTASAITHRIPGFFQPNVFLVMDWFTVLVFAGLTWAGVRMRARTEWHRRLMLCGAIEVMGPGLGRLVPLPLLGDWMLWGVWLAMLPFIGAAIGFDLATRGRVHPAYLWGFGIITASVALIRPLANTAPMLALTHYLTG